MKRIAVVLVLAVMAVSMVSALEYNGGFLVQGVKRNLAVDGGESGYDIMAIGGQIVFGIDDPATGIGMISNLGVAGAWKKSLNGKAFSSEPDAPRANVYDYNAALGVKWEHFFNGFGLYADVHLSWVSVAFQKGTEQEWERLSFHTLGLGWTAGASFAFDSSSISGRTRLLIGLSGDYGLLSFTAKRSRAHWDTSSAVYEKIDASSSAYKVIVGVLAGFY